MATEARELGEAGVEPQQPEIAAVAGISPAYVGDNFELTKASGETFASFINREPLQTGLQIEDLGIKSGDLIAVIKMGNEAEHLQLGVVLPRVVDPTKYPLVNEHERPTMAVLVDFDPEAEKPAPRQTVEINKDGEVRAYLGYRLVVAGEEVPLNSTDLQPSFKCSQNGSMHPARLNILWKDASNMELEEIRLDSDVYSWRYGDSDPKRYDPVTLVVGPERS